MLNREFVRFLRHARGSLAEIETQILIAAERKYVGSDKTAQFSQRLDELGRVLSGLINSQQRPEADPNSGRGTQD